MDTSCIQRFPEQGTAPPCSKCRRLQASCRRFDGLPATPARAGTRGTRSGTSERGDGALRSLDRNCTSCKNSFQPLAGTGRLHTAYIPCNLMSTCARLTFPSVTRVGASSRIALLLNVPSVLLYQCSAWSNFQYVENTYERVPSLATPRSTTLEYWPEGHTRQPASQRM